MADGYPTPSAVINWVMDDRDDCAALYARAREVQAMLLLDEIQEIADDGESDFLKHDKDGNPVMDKEFAARSKLRVDTRRWAMSKMLPKVYGDKLDLNHAGKVDGDVTVKVTGVQLLLEAAKRNDAKGYTPEVDGGGQPTETIEEAEADSDDV